MLTADGFRLDGRVALITGSGRDIGRAVAECFAASGARVVINGHRDKAALDKTAAVIRDKGGEVSPVMADVSEHHAVDAMIDETVRTFGAGNIAANTVSPGPIDTVRDWSRYPHRKPEDVIARVPLGRYGHVDEIAGACLFLASAAGGYVTGQVIHVNAGSGMY